MNEILERYRLHSQNIERTERPSSSESQPVEIERPMLSKEAAEKMGPLRKMIGEHLQGMNTEELEQLEKSLEAGLSRLQMKKAEKITTEIESLQQKGRELMEENNRLKHQKMVMEMARGGRQPIPADLENTIRGEGPSSESATNSSRLPRDYESSDTSLKLG
ncbi:MADS-box protein JOINTLESS [Heracleum sosnowskyi]|uniref:MADS-box protein JOINTLESS n=1 Tax=Heracleum sosnowskyi TaxID=360622 RepID=A0AAD8J6C6_9APIA|nr:MADS-box protein JOINTLESS [Heracleum sosnowskyi]